MKKRKKKPSLWARFQCFFKHSDELGRRRIETPDEIFILESCSRCGKILTTIRHENNDIYWR